jgi:hypothetical protein
LDFLLLLLLLLQACDALVQLIKDNGRWVDMPEPEEAEAVAV